MASKNSLFIATSLYSLFLFLLIKKNWEEIDFVLYDRIPKPIIESMKKQGLSVFYIKTGLGVFSGIYARLVQFLISNFEFIRYLFNRKFRKYISVYGNDELSISVLYWNKGIVLIEDGIFNYKSEHFFIKRQKSLMNKISIWSLFTFYLNVKYIPYGYSNQVKKIFLTGEAALPEALIDKVEVINIRNLWKAKSENEKCDIMRLFSIDRSIVECLHNYTSILLTQPIAQDEDGTIPELEKIEIYKKILINIDEERLIIKTHYAEKTNYRKYFGKALIIDQPIPFQLFDLLDYHPTKVITISSTAALKFSRSNSELIFTGTEIDHRIVKMYGVININNLTGSYTI